MPGAPPVQLLATYLGCLPISRPSPLLAITPLPPRAPRSPSCPPDIQTKSRAWHGIFRFLRFGSTQSTMSSSITVFAICLGCLGCCGVRWNAVSLDAKPTKMRHLCKNMLKAVQNTTTRVSNILSNVCIRCPVPHPFPTQPHTFLQSQDHSVYSLLKTSVQNTTIRLLTIIVRVIGISMPSLSGTTPFPMATSAASISLNPRLPLSQ